MSVARHTSYNLAGALLPIGISLILTPVLVAVVGLARYGLLSIYLILLGYLGLFDLGTGRAVGQRIALLRNETARRRNQAFWTSLTICLALCAFAAIVVMAAVPLIVRFLDVNDIRLASELNASLYWLALGVPLAMLGSQFSGALEGAERFAFVNAASILTSVLILGLPLAAAVLISPALDVLAAAATLARLLSVIALAAGAAALLRIGRPRFDRDDAARLLGFGGWLTISNIVGPVLLLFDRFLIGRLISAAATGIYVLPYSVMSQLQIFPTALNRTLFPKMAAASAADRPDGSADAIALLNMVMTCLLALAAPLLLPFFSLWVGPAIGKAASPVAFALMPGIWANSLAMITATALQARANTRFLALVHLAEILPYLALLYAGVHYFGVVGAGIAWSVRCVVDAAIIFAWQRVRVDSSIVLSGLCIAAICAVSLLTSASDPLHWILVVAIAALAVWQAWVQRPPTMRLYEDRILSALRRIGSN